jgi:hypothetical protein
MKRWFVLIGILGVMTCSPALAGDEGPVPAPWPWFRGFPLDPTGHAHSNSVRISDACWRTCETACSRRFQACATSYRVNDCRSESDRCDVSCLMSCRTYGGPFFDVPNSGSP